MYVYVCACVCGNYSLPLYTYLSIHWLDCRLAVVEVDRSAIAGLPDSSGATSFGFMFSSIVVLLPLYTGNLQVEYR